MLSEKKHKVILPENFKRYFWDVAFEELSWEKNQRFIVERLLNYGSVKEIKWLIASAGKKYIKSVVKNSRNLNVKTKNYWNVMLTPVSRKSI
jgi:hypothetical protein